MGGELGRIFGVAHGATLTAVGLADAVRSEVSQALCGARGPAPRPAPPERPGDLRARGSRVIRRWTAGPDHHMEVMARRVARAAEAGDGA